MTTAERNYELATQRMIVARAQLLRQIARDNVSLADLLTFARQIGDESVADNLAAFRSAQEEVLRAAQSELARLTG